MNKTVTFNLNGLVFTIEEDGYESLRLYLDAVQRYLDKMDGGREILLEIEARIAEKFKNVLQRDDRMVLVLADVELVKAEMGSPEQFQEWDDDTAFDAGQPAEAADQAADTPRQLFRNKRQRMLGGVSSGLAHHLGVDVVAIRLLFILSVFLFAGYGIVIYLILWVSIPATDQLPEQVVLQRADGSRRIYRNEANKVIAGVASGLAAYLKIDAVIVRVLFLLAMFWGGFGLLAYLVLWIATPAAKSLSQKVEMEGEQPNLANLRKAVVRKDEQPNKTLLERVLALPFEIIRAVFGLMRNLLTGALSVFRVVGGSVVLMAAAFGLFIYVVIVGAAVGVYFGSIPAETPFPLASLSGSTGSDLGILFFASAFLLIPLLIALYLGIRFLFNRSIFSRKVIFVGVVSWLALGIALVFFGLRTATFYQQEGKFVTNQDFGKAPARLVLQYDDDDQRFQPAGIEVVASKDSSLQLRQEIVSRGLNAEDAEAWASMARYPIDKTDDTTLMIGRSLKFLPGARFRAQEGRIKVLLPKGSKLSVPRDLLWQFSWDDPAYREILRSKELVRYEFVVTPDSLRCVNCQPIEAESRQDL
ncbi:MAG: hypothetical protein C0424_11335 [Sphingobacteriaceae bacterium]|nr:hypothetical protein [Sphingobacteriaceae bacterium]